MADQTNPSPLPEEALYSRCLREPLTNQDPIAAEIQDALANESLPPAARIPLLFALGNLYHRGERFDDAFKYFEDGNRLQIPFHDIEMNDVRNSFGRLQAALTKSFYEEHAGWGTDSNLPVFIVGMPQTGKTLVEKILTHNPSVYGAGERMEPLQFAKSLPERLGLQKQYPECLVELTQDAAREEGKAFVDELTQQAPFASYITDTIPNNVAVLGLIGLIAPKAPIIHCVRDPLETGLACYFKRFLTGQPFAIGLEKTGLFYKYYEALMAHWRTVLPNPWLEVRFDDLIGQFQDTANKASRFLGLEGRDTLEQPAPAGPVITPASVKAYEKYLTPLRNALTGEGRETLQSGMSDTSDKNAGQSQTMTLQQALDLAGKHAKEGRFVEAEQIIRKLITAAPGTAGLHENLGRLLFVQKRWPEAAEEFNTALKLDHNLAAAHHQLGLMMTQSKQFDGAAEHFEKAHTLKPDDIAVLYNWALMLFSKRDIDAAQEKAKALIAQAPQGASQLPQAHYMLGVIAEEKSDLEGAVTNYARALELKPDYAQAKNNLEIASRYVRKTDAELRGLQERAAENLQNPAAHFEWVYELWEQGKFNEAGTALATAQARWTKNITGDYFEGLYKQSIGKTAESLKAFARARKIDPDDPVIQYAEESVKHTQRKKKPPKKAKRVALHLNHKFHTSILGPVFDELKKRHPVLMTAHLRNLIDFEPDVIVTAETHSAFLRHYLPDADYVGVRHGLISKKTTYNGARMNDYYCVTSEANRDWYADHNAKPRKAFWVTGYVQMDPLFNKKKLTIPVKKPKGHKIVLYAPTWSEDFTSAPLLGDKLVELMCGARDDITLIIKPHPVTFKVHPQLIALWRNMAAKHDHVHLVDRDDVNIMAYLKNADVLVSDVSSVVYQYLAMDRPIVLLTNPRAVQSGSRDPDGIEWTHRDVGEHVGDIKDLAGCVDRALNDPTIGAEARAKCAEYLFGDLRDGKAAKRVAEHIKALED